MTGNLVYRCFCRKLSNGETESAKARVEDSESDQATTPSKDGTLVIRQVRDSIQVVRRLIRYKVVVFPGYSAEMCVLSIHSSMCYTLFLSLWTCNSI